MTTMHFLRLHAALACAGLGLGMAGCAPQAPKSSPVTSVEHDHDEAHAESAGRHDHSHTHTGDDSLVWGRSDLQHAGFVIQLGHHSQTLHAGTSMEPAVSITRDGQPVGDAQVFNSLLASEGGAVLAAEAPTVYEPPTDDEPAHYAQGELAIPAGTTSGTIHFRIALPGIPEEATFDLPVRFVE